MSKQDELGVLPDVLRPGLTVVFCGTQAGRLSAKLHGYYAGSGNKFWSTLHLVGLTPERYEPQQFVHLLDHGLGLTDVAKSTWGPDIAIRRHHLDVTGFLNKIIAHAPRYVAFNGKRAASAALKIKSKSLPYGLTGLNIGSSSVFVLPSTSGAAAAYWSLAPWTQLANLVRLSDG